MTPRSRTVDNGKSMEEEEEEEKEEAESESSAHCRGLEKRSNQMNSYLVGLSIRCIDRLHSMMSSMQARCHFVAFATPFNRKCTL